MDATNLARSLVRELLVNASISINNVWLVDGLKHNVLSISKFCDDSYDVLFDKTSYTVVNKDDNSIIFKGKRMDNVYKIN